MTFRCGNNFWTSTPNDLFFTVITGLRHKAQVVCGLQIRIAGSCSWQPEKSATEYCHAHIAMSLCYHSRDSPLLTKQDDTSAMTWRCLICHDIHHYFLSVVRKTPSVALYRLQNISTFPAYFITSAQHGSGVLWSICVSVCLSVRADISRTTWPIFTNFCGCYPWCSDWMKWCNFRAYVFAR